MHVYQTNHLRLWNYAFIVLPAHPSISGSWVVCTTYLLGNHSTVSCVPKAMQSIPARSAVSTSAPLMCPRTFRTISSLAGCCLLVCPPLPLTAHTGARAHRTLALLPPLCWQGCNTFFCYGYVHCVKSCGVLESYALRNLMRRVYCSARVQLRNARMYLHTHSMLEQTVSSARISL